MNDLSHLVSLARRVLGAASEEETLEGIVRYSEAFEKWADEFLGPHKDVLASKRAELKELQVLHAQVIARAEQLKSRVSQAMRKLKKKGKGILAYTDTFPKRIGSMRPRKL